jgi:hypothetical protein
VGIWPAEHQYAMTRTEREMTEGEELRTTREAIHRLGDDYRAGRLTRKQFTRAVLRKGQPWNLAGQEALYRFGVEVRLNEHFCELWYDGHDCERIFIPPHPRGRRTDAVTGIRCW